MSAHALQWFQRVVVQVDVEPTQLRATARRRGTLCWELMVEREAGESIASAIGALLARVPRPRWPLPTPAVVVRVGAECVQVKRLRGLPDTQDARLLSAVLREGASRFFVGEPAALLTSDVRLREDGTVWAAAFRRALVAEIADRVRADGYAVVSVVPMTDLELRAPLAAPNASSVSRARAALALSAAVVALLGGALAPALVASRQATIARTELASFDAPTRRALTELASLDAVTSALEAYGATAARRQSAIAFLSRLTVALPSETALLMIRLDSLGGTLVAVGPRASTLVSRLDSMPAVSAPEIVGPVTREVVAGRELERATVRFARGARP